MATGDDCGDSMTYTFAWGNNAKRATLKGRRCRILARGRMRSVLVEFESGQREIVSLRALRPIGGDAAGRQLFL